MSSDSSKVSPRRARKLGEIIQAAAAASDAEGYNFLAGLWVRKEAADGRAPGGAGVVGAFPEEMALQTPEAIVRALHTGLLSHEKQHRATTRLAFGDTGGVAPDVLAEVGVLSRLLTGYVTLAAEVLSRLGVLGLSLEEVARVLAETLPPDVRATLRAALSGSAIGEIEARS